MELLFRSVLVMDGGSAIGLSPAPNARLMRGWPNAASAVNIPAEQSAIGTLFAGLRRWRSLRAARQELLALDDRLLADVGLDRDTVKWELEERIER